MLKRAEIQLKSVEGAAKQAECQMEPVIMKADEFKSKKQQKDAEIAELANEVDLLRKKLALRVN